MKFFFTLSFLSAFALTSNASILVTCRTQVRNPVKVLEYLVKSNLSNRLSSAVLFTKNNSTTIFQLEDIAQFGFAKEAIYILADNDYEIPVLRLFAQENKKMYSGSVAEYSADGKISATTKVDCILTNQ